MFKFWRRRVGPAEVWIILVREDLAPDLVRRFGSPVLVDEAEAFRCHEVGQVFVANDEDRSEFFLACHFELTIEERQEILRELKLLLGRPVFGLGAEFEKCWALHEELSDDRSAH